MARGDAYVDNLQTLAANIVKEAHRLKGQRYWNKNMSPTVSYGTGWATLPLSLLVRNTILKLERVGSTNPLYQKLPASFQASPEQKGRSTLFAVYQIVDEKRLKLIAEERQVALNMFGASADPGQALMVPVPISHLDAMKHLRQEIAEADDPYKCFVEIVRNLMPKSR